MLPDANRPGADLPVRPALATLLAAVADRGAALLIAPPGSGKTSLLPLALADHLPGTIVVAEPRRIATRAAAQQLAHLVREKPGGRVGYAMRGERTPGSRIEVVTTGLLAQRLQRDPELPGVSAVVIDECHERQLDADLVLAFATDVRANLRPDLVVVATSATPDSDRIAEALGADGDPAPVVTATAARFDVEVSWAPAGLSTPLLADARVDPRLLDQVAATVRRALTEAEGDVLVFVPGEAEIHAVTRRLAGTVDVLPLFGRQTAAEQNRALTAGPNRRIVVTTSVAESSLTVPGIRIVVDAGLARQPRTDHVRGLSALVTTRVSKASADQRAGRAGREAPGRVYRCWSAADHAHLTPHTPPEIATADLAGFALSVAEWGAPGGAGLALLDPPPPAAMAAARSLLTDLGATDDEGRITRRGRQIAAVPAHPRLARALLDGAELAGTDRAREIVALLSGDGLAGRADDLPARLRMLRQRTEPAATVRWRDEVARLRLTGEPSSRTTLTDDLAVAGIVALAYPDRLAKLRRPDSTSYLLAGGTGAALDQASPLRGSPWLAVADADRPIGRADARIRSAAPLDEETARSIAQVRTDDEVGWADDRLVLRRREHLGAITLSESPLRHADPALITAAVEAGVRASGLDVLRWNDDARQLRLRLAFCHDQLGDPWPDVSDDALLAGLDRWLGPDLAKVRRGSDLARIPVTAALRRLLPWPAASRLDELAPERLEVPTGQRLKVTYAEGQLPTLALRVQEAFGWLDTPRIADGRVEVVLQLLSPAGRPVAVTSDLRSFWAQGYPQVRADLRGRYPRHPWPDDPLHAEPTRRAAPRKR